MNKRKIKSNYLLSSYFLTSEDINQAAVTLQYSKAFIYRLDNGKQVYKPARVVMQYLNCIRKEDPVNER